jgi:hypothetical protein
MAIENRTNLLGVALLVNEELRILLIRQERGASPPGGRPMVGLVSVTKYHPHTYNVRPLPSSLYYTALTSLCSLPSIGRTLAPSTTRFDRLGFEPTD